MKRFSYCANCGEVSASAASCGRIASAASMPSSTNFGAAAKSMNERLPRSGEIRMSPGLSSASCARTFCSVRMLIICDAKPTSDCNWSRDMSGVPMLTAMTMSAPIARTTSTGRLLTRPPSPRMRPSSSIGANIPGTDMLARIA